MPLITSFHEHQHQVHEKVYVRDDDYGWLPANIMEVQKDRALVCIQLPSDWNDSTVITCSTSQNDTSVRSNNLLPSSSSSSSSTSNNSFEQLNYQHRWVYYKDYKYGKLPLQNTKVLCRDVATDLEHINEAEVLYQIKARYTRSTHNPYTRVGNICMLAMGGTNSFSNNGLYSSDRQRAYARKYCTNRTTGPLSVSSSSSLSPIATLSDEKKECESSLSSSSAYQQGNRHFSYTRNDDLLAYEPHIYEISSQVYDRTIHSRINGSDRHQTIIVTGESGSGKTETSKILIQHLLLLPKFLLESQTLPGGSTNSKSRLLKRGGTNNTFEIDTENDLIQYVLRSTHILEAFGHAQTIHNTNSSRYAKVTYLQYSDVVPNTSSNIRTSNSTSSSLSSPLHQQHHQQIVGTTIHTYLLETSRVVDTTRSIGERNFNIFYQLLASSPGTKEILLGPSWVEATYQDFKYLLDNTDNNNNNNNNNNTGHEQSNHDDDAKIWETTKNAMKLFCWDDASLKVVVQCLGIILRLGNLTFDSNPNGSVFISSKEDLIWLSHELGISLMELDKALTGRTISSTSSANRSPTTHKKDNIRQDFTINDAIKTCELLAKAIYNRLFASIVRQINILTNTNIPPSFLTMEATDNTTSSHFPVVANDPSSTCNNVTTTRKNYTLSIVDVFGFENGIGKNKQGCSFQQFCTNYVAEKVQQKYVHDLLVQYKIEFDQEGINLPDFQSIDNIATITLLERYPNGILPTLNRQTFISTSSSETMVLDLAKSNSNNESFVRHGRMTQTEFGIRHFAGPVTYDGANFMEKNIDQLSPALISLMSKSTNRLLSQEFGRLMITPVDHVKEQRNASTVVGKIEKELQELVGSLDNCETHYIRCIRPSSRSTDNKRQIEHNFVLNQLRSSGIFVALDLSKKAFPHKITFETVDQRFLCLLDHASIASVKDMELHDRVQVMMSIIFAPVVAECSNNELSIPYVCGKTRVYFREGALELLEYQRKEFINQTVIRLQTWTRKFMALRKFQTASIQIVKLQALARRRPRMLQYRSFRRGIVMIQANARMGRSRGQYSTIRESVRKIQLWLVPRLQRYHAQRLYTAATKIARWRRLQRFRNEEFRYRWLSTMGPVYLKTMKGLRCYDTKKSQKLSKTIQSTSTLFTHKIPFHLLEERFVCLIPDNSLKAMDALEGKDKAQLILLILFAPFIDECQQFQNFPMPFLCGLTRVYFRSGSLEVLEILRREHYTTAAIEIQRFARGMRQRKEYKVARRSVQRIQEHYRSRIAKDMTLTIALSIQTLKIMGFLKPAYVTALLKARTNTVKIFPYILSYSVANNRFASLAPTKSNRSLADLEPLAVTEHVMLNLFAPFVESGRTKRLPMPFSCREEGVFLRVGALEVLEILRKETIRRKTIKIQSIFRMKIASQYIQKARNGAVKIQSIYRTYFSRSMFERHCRSAIKIQTLWRSKVRKSDLEKETAVSVIVSAVRASIARRELQKRKTSAKLVTKWIRSVHSQSKLQNEPVGAISIGHKSEYEQPVLSSEISNKSSTSSRKRSGNERIRRILIEGMHNDVTCVLPKKAETASSCRDSKKDNETLDYVADFVDSVPISNTSEDPKVKSPTTLFPEEIVCTANEVENANSLSLQTEQPRTVQPPSDENQVSIDEANNTLLSAISEVMEAHKLILFSEESQDFAAMSEGAKGNTGNESSNAQAALTGEHTTDQSSSGDCDKVTNERARLDLDMERLYQEQMQSLRNEMIQAATEAERYKQELETEYEERLAAYEAEVLQLQYNVENLEVENENLKKKIILTQERYDEKLETLKLTMKKTEDSHRKYLEQVMTSVEKSKVENAKALEALAEARDSKIRGLEDEISKLKSEQMKSTLPHNPTAEHSETINEVHRLVQKFEKIVSSQHIAKLCDKFQGDPKNLKIAIEDKVSYKARNIAGRLERMISASTTSPQTINIMTEEAEGEIQQLEQQLAHAYEEIEKLETELSPYRARRDANTPKNFCRLSFF